MTNLNFKLKYIYIYEIIDILPIKNIRNYLLYE